MKVLYIFRTARNKILNGYLNKTEPSTMLYGLVELKKTGVSVGFTDIAFHPFNIFNYLLLPFERVFISLIRYPLGYKLHQALVLLPYYYRHNIIVCTQDSAGLPILLLKRLGIFNKKIVYICNNLTPLLIKTSKTKLIKFFLWHLRAADLIICLSEMEKNIINKYLPKKAVHIPFGIDTSYFVPVLQQKYEFEILAVGRDILRDYSTLIQAVSKTSWKVAIVCSPNNLSGLSIPSNVKVFYDIDPLKLRLLYSKSRIVVIPMKGSVPKSQGQVVFLEATAMNKPVIASNVKGLTTAFNVNRFENLTLVKPESYVALHNCIVKTLKKHETIKHMSNSERKSISMERFAHDLHNRLLTL